MTPIAPLHEYSTVRVVASLAAEQEPEGGRAASCHGPLSESYICPYLPLSAPICPYLLPLQYRSVRVRLLFSTFQLLQRIFIATKLIRTKSCKASPLKSSGLGHPFRSKREGGEGNIRYWG